MISQFAEISSDSIAQMSAELESVINRKVVEIGEKILLEYQEKLTRFDEDSAGEELKFDTVDLIKGALKNMQETVVAWCSDDFAAEAVEDFGEVTYETKSWRESRRNYRRLARRKNRYAPSQNGSHKEKAGKRKVKNPKKKWYTFWRSSYIEEDVYVTVDDYKSEDVYKTVMDYQTVMRDVFEERS